jgi:hypothetical protein
MCLYPYSFDYCFYGYRSCQDAWLAMQDSDIYSGISLITVCINQSLYHFEVTQVWLLLGIAELKIADPEQDLI